MNTSLICKRQTLVRKGTSSAELEAAFRTESPVSKWFQWQVGELTGGMITKDSTPFEIRTKICQIAERMKSSVAIGESSDTKNTYPLDHLFTPGLYTRSIHIPAMHMIVGRLHKHELVNVILKGRVTVITEAGGVEELIGPCMFVSPAGVKRLLFTHSDTVWTLMHPTNKTDLDQIEAEFIAESYTEIGLEQPCVKLLTS